MNKIIDFLKKKSVPIDQFINIALYNKKFGYYMKKNPFGKKGDYITSPLISRLFGEMVGIWCVAFWEHLKKPKKILLVELGPGDGSLCLDLLNTFKNFKEFNNSLEIKLLEKSIKLKKIQKKKIQSPKVKWINNISELNKGPVIIIGNEFFDSLPIKQIYRKKNLFLEKHITVSNNDKKIKFLYKKANKKLINKIKYLNLSPKEGIIEYPSESIKYLNAIAKIIKKYNGGLLIIDYGYNKKNNKNSLQALEKHKHVNIFSNPGNIDITSHINFKLFSNILKKSNLDVKTVVTQSEFLSKLGIIERANILSRTYSFKQKADMFYRLKRLMHYKEMGYLFKVLFAQKKKVEFFLGF